MASKKNLGFLGFLKNLKNLKSPKFRFVLFLWSNFIQTVLNLIF